MKNMNHPKSNEIFFLFQFQQKLWVKRKIESPIRNANYSIEKKINLAKLNVLAQ